MPRSTGRPGPPRAAPGRPREPNRGSIRGLGRQPQLAAGELGGAPRAHRVRRVHAVEAHPARREPAAHRHRLRLTLAREWRGGVPPAHDALLRGVRLALPVSDQVERQRLPAGAQQQLLPPEGEIACGAPHLRCHPAGPEAWRRLAHSAATGRRRRRKTGAHVASAAGLLRRAATCALFWRLGDANFTRPFPADSTTGHHACAVGRSHREPGPRRPRCNAQHG